MSRDTKYFAAGISHDIKISIRYLKQNTFTLKDSDCKNRVKTDSVAWDWTLGNDLKCTRPEIVMIQLEDYPGK